MIIIFSSLRKLIYMLLGLPSILGLIRKPDVSVLCYHSIASDGWRFSTNLMDFEKHIKLLERYYHFITIDEFQKYLEGKISFECPALLLTFDDGYKNIISVKALLKKYSIKPVVFLIADGENVDRNELATDLPLLNTRDSLALVNSGWSIGSHTMTHANILKRSINAKYEILDSKKSLEKEMGIKVRYFAYPKGRYSKRILNQVNATKYHLAFTMDDAYISTSSNRLTLPRVGIDGSHSPFEVLCTTQPLTIKFRQIIRKTLKINI